jgi:hypothetical protein
MHTLTIFLAMVGLSVILLAGAIISDNLLRGRLARRQEEIESGTAEEKKDAADTVIDFLGRTTEVMRKAMQAGGEDKPDGNK